MSYNSAAAGNDATPYGDPWQLINVFDGDMDTDVVCEGYSKAFKFLFDLSGLGDDYDCLLVSGMMTGGTGAGAHMWNVVRWDNGGNYLVDVTNCDADSVGYPDKLFMACAAPDDQGAYTFDCGGGNAVTYRYDDDTAARTT